MKNIIKRKIHSSYNALIRFILGIKVSKFQKQFFLFSFVPKNDRNYFFDFCPKNLKWVKWKNNASIVLYQIPPTNIIKCLHFFWFDPFFEARAEIQKYDCSFFGSNENNKICFRTLLTFSLFSASIWLMLKLLVYLSQGSFRGSCPTLRQWIRCNFHGGWMRGVPP